MKRRCRRALQHLRADLVLLDANLGSPHGGVELVASGAIGEDTATVLVSDEVDEELLERTRRVGADGFLVWPASRLQVEATICAALGARRFRPPPADGQVQATAVLHRIARELAGVTGKDARLVELILSESRSVIRARGRPMRPDEVCAASTNRSNSSRCSKAGSINTSPRRSSGGKNPCKLA